MMLALKALFAGRAWWGWAAVAVVALLLWVQTERLGAAQDSKTAIEQQRDLAIDANVSNQDTIAKLRAAQRRQAQRINALDAELLRTHSDYQALEEKVRDDQAPVPADVCALLDELRRLAGQSGPACRAH